MAENDTRRQADNQEVKAASRGLAGRIVLIIVLIVVALLALGWRMVAGDYKKALRLYDDGKYEEAQVLFEKVIAHPLSAIRIRGQARKALGLCKAEIASDIALNERSLEGYDRALKLLEEAKNLAGPTEEIERRIKEYSEYRQRLVEAEASQPQPKPAETPATPGGTE